MAMDLAKKTFSTDRKYIEASTNIRVATAVKTAAEALKAHAPVILDEAGKMKAVTSAELSDLSGLYGITADSVDAAEKDVVILMTGEYFSDSLALEDGVTADKLETAFRNIGIFLK